MAEHRRDALVFFLIVAVALGTYTASQAIETYEPLSAFLPLLCLAAFVAYKVVPWLLDKLAAETRAEFFFPVYLLRNAAGLVLCTEEPSGGHLAVFTGLDPAARFREVRGIPEWSPVAFSHAELLEALQWAKRSGRVQYVMIDPMVAPYGFSPVFPLSHCIERLSE